MIKLSFASKDTDPFTVLCLGAHSDDIEIGCGGTLLYLKKILPHLDFIGWFSTHRAAADQKLLRLPDLFTSGSTKKIVLKEFRDGFLPYPAQRGEGFL